MSLWNLDLEGFPPQWLDIATRFEDGQAVLLLKCATEKDALRLRFEWYAFKRKLRNAEAARGAERLYPTLPRVTAEVGQLRSGAWAVRLRLRDTNKTAVVLIDALGLSSEELEMLDADFDAGNVSSSEKDKGAEDA